MVATSKTWSATLNTLFTSAIDQAVQYREAFFALKSRFLLAGWTLELSCNGTTASAADNLPNAAAVVFGTPTTQPISYFVMAAPGGTGPSGWGTPGGADRFRVLIVTNNSNADATPNNIDMYMSRGVYALAGTPLQNRPTTAVDEVSLTARGLCPWAAAASARWNAWHTADGDVIFGLKFDGDIFFRSFFVWTAQTASGLGSYRGLMFQTSAAAADCVTAANLGASGNWRGFSANGAAITANIGLSSIGFDLTSWSGGVEASTGSIPNIDAHLRCNGSGDNARYYGQFIDVRAAPGAAPFNELIDGDTDPLRLVLIGDLWIPAPTASLPLQ